MKTALLLTLPMALLAGCATQTAPAPMTHSPNFAPVLPAPQVSAAAATGSIYNPRVSDNWFGRGRNYAVGDVITVVLSESTQATREQRSNVDRKASNDVIPSAENAPNGLAARVQRAALPSRVLGTTLSGVMGGVNLNGGSIESGGGGDANQLASLSGSVSVSVVEVLANGNLMVRGEKQLALTEGTEIIQVSGIIRPDDISPNNVVQSRRLANAQIAYRGTGDMANASRAGWGTSLLLKLWPF